MTPSAALAKFVGNLSVSALATPGYLELQRSLSRSPLEEFADAVMTLESHGMRFTVEQTAKIIERTEELAGREDTR